MYKVQTLSPFTGVWATIGSAPTFDMACIIRDSETALGARARVSMEVPSRAIRALAAVEAR